MRRRTLTSTTPPPFDANGYDYVDMGEDIGIWATCNVGAETEFDCGLYFAWGETKGYKDITDKDGGFIWETTPYWVSGTQMYELKWSKYTTHDGSSSTGVADNKVVLELEDDAAHVIMGGDWRTPTAEEFKNLINVCGVSPSKVDNSGTRIKGRELYLKTDYSKTLFLPSGGFYLNSSVYSPDDFFYATSTLYDGYNYYMMRTDSQNNSLKINCEPYLRRAGHIIRAIIKNKEE